MNRAHMDPLTSPLSRSFPVALGTAGFGTDTSISAAFSLLDAYANRGGNHIDTAHDYASWIPGGDGASEKTIGQWLRSHGVREGMLIATKGGCTKDGKKRVRRDILRDELALSLERLGTRSVDLYWLHRDDASVPVCEILEWLEELKREGLVAAYGASNWTWQRLAEARRYALERGLSGFAGSQCGWNLAALDENPFDTADAHFLKAADEAWLRETQLPLVAWESQAGGFFSGLYGPERKPNSSRGHVVKLHYGNARNWNRLSIARELAEKYSVTSNQIILAWMRYQPFPVISIIGPRTIAQLLDSMHSVEVSLSEQEVELLRRL